MASKPKHIHPLILIPKLKLLIFLIWLLLLLLHFTSNSIPQPTPQIIKCPPKIHPFYIIPLPQDFNQALLTNCHSLNVFTDMCPHVSNRGLGRKLTNKHSWYATHQFIAEMIFHARAEQHPCRALDPARAKMFYVPFYAGLYASSKFGERDFKVRDGVGAELAEFVVGLESWRRMNGRDHFMVVGRTAWDFMRANDDVAGDFGANRLLLLPPVKNMSILTVERHPWQGNNQFGIPYPSYFHPYTSSDVAQWQDSVRRSNRTHLFSFVGGPRVNVEKAAVRNDILRQCAQSNQCIRVQCEPGSAKCHEPDRVLEVMKRSVFCMQPPGDSFTRRSVFDSLLAGCVPVFFSEHTAYTQYRWYFPVRREEWSVFIERDRWGSIEEELKLIDKERVKRMREKVIEIIPFLTYAHPNASFGELGFEDAVDIALMELTKRVNTIDLKE